MNIVLFQPEIPHNTGAIGRTCLITGSTLHLIHPLGFNLSEKSLKRSGLDYWQKIDVRHYLDYDDFVQQNFSLQTNYYFVETGGKSTYAQVQYNTNDYLIFGSETRGLPHWILDKNYDKIISIPMVDGERSLNLSVAAGIVLYEALRQNAFKGLS